jgi:S-formylglutathione hydrolase FrmB
MSLRDPASGRRHQVLVYRPAVADSSTLPVLYFLHGVPGQASDVFRAGLAQSLDRYFAQGHAPFVVVAPDGNGARADTEWVDSADGRDRLESFITKVVIPAVEGGHPRDRAHRAISGFSMGGYGAFNIAEHHPQLFGQVVAVAGYFHVDDPSGALGGNAALIARDSPDRHLAALRGTRLLLLDSTHDTQRVVQGESQRMERLLTAAGVPATLHVAPGGHDWRYVASQFGTIERFLEAGWDS